MSITKFKLALIQLAVGTNKAENLLRAGRFIQEAAKKGAHLVTLPECFNSPYGTGYFAEYAEQLETGESSLALSSAAKENKIYLVGGSIPEKKDGKLYNTCTVWGPDGGLLAVHRKVHLFDIDIPGKIKFQESETLSPGNEFTSFQMGDICKVGVGICYDIRFAEMAQIYARNDCRLLIYPGAFNMTTGPAHWELLQRCRAVDNQVYVATASPARSESSSYVAWGHSSAVSPWGEVIASTDEKESVVYADIDLDFLEQIRSQIPITHQRRPDMYEVVQKKN
ncbi:hypothetical protein DAPPUDRAFT_328325 [Daphnia pulex]|uniref:omega-amidase n=1 Tax=Daphnia pulex TaxID=6669 RepID=E9HCU7_DAPPU|nr:hypothetical protein DAPPUDRAFT_328325 [Daphnia pulex]|eukprot:EFX70459.1 hypothetical protein DAPPUDRAFT_328325 [Daphnia pulex]